MTAVAVCTDGEPGPRRSPAAADPAGAAGGFVLDPRADRAGNSARARSEGGWHACPSRSPPAFAPALPPAARERFGPPNPEADTAPAVRSIETVALPQSNIQPPPSSPPQSEIDPAAVVDAANAPPPSPSPQAEPAPSAGAEPAPKPSAPPAAAPRRPLAFAEVVDAIKALPRDAEESEPPAEAPRPSAAMPPPKVEGDAAAVDAAATDSRHWVQIASAPDSLVTSEYRRLKGKHPKLLSDKDGYRTPFGRSNRVLVGPFASADEARDFVGQLKKSSLTAVAWTSPQGQEIDKIPGK